MKKIIAITGAVLLSGCDAEFNLHNNQIDYAQSYCESHGGVSYMHGNNVFFTTFKIRCVDGKTSSHLEVSNDDHWTNERSE